MLPTALFGHRDWIPEKVDKIPSTLNWDLFSGPAKVRPYNALYSLELAWLVGLWYRCIRRHGLSHHAPGIQRLEFGLPTKVQGSSTLLLQDCAPQAQHVKLTFPARDNMPKVGMPEVEVHWYDGGMMPDRPKGFPQGKQLMGEGGGLVIFHGTKDTLICE